MVQKGFTLIELLIVMGVLGVLATGVVAVTNPLAQMQKANDTKRKSDLAQVQRALETYYQDQRSYPTQPLSNDYRIKWDGNPVDWGTAWLPFMNVLPKDPKSSKKYVYYSTSDKQSYYLYASLDRGAEDPQACKDDGSVCDSIATNGIPATECGGAGTVCNYGVSSPNVSP